jgi:hypothetical protein
MSNFAIHQDEQSSVLHTVLIGAFQAAIAVLAGALWFAPFAA